MFENIITDYMKELHKDAISEVIRGHQTPCTLYLPSTKTIACSSCNNTNIGNTGPNPFLAGGYGEHTTCSKCGGKGRVPVQAEVDVNLALIWDFARYQFFGSAVAERGEVMSISSISLLKDIKACNYGIFNTDLSSGNKHQFYLVGEPQPCGFGADHFIMCMWGNQQ